MENLEKKCPRCGKASANSNNPSGRCSTCLKKLAANKKKPGHWQRAQTKADDALRRQDGKNGTAHHKSSGRGNRDSIVKQVKRAEKKTGQKLSPDRKDNGKGYASSNTRMVPEKLNRGRHKVDSKKLKEWHKKIKKHSISDELLYTALLVKSRDRSTELYLAITKVIQNLQKANKKQLTQMLGSMASEPQHLDAIKKIKELFPNSNHDVWLTKHYRNDPSILKDHYDTLKHLSAQIKVHGDDLRLHDVSKMGFKEGLDSMMEKERQLARTATSKFEDHVYRPSSNTTEELKTNDNRAWFNINKPGCSKLGLLLGHCGNAGGSNNDSLHYLAEAHVDEHGKPYHKPSSTFILNNGYLGEMKGKHNLKPGPEDHGAIMDLLLSDKVKGIIGGGYLPASNFSLSDLTEEQRQHVLRKKPNIDILDTPNKLDPDNYPETFAQTIGGHNQAIDAINAYNGEKTKLIDDLIGHPKGHQILSALISHPKYYKMFDKEDLEKIIQAELSMNPDSEG